MLIDQAHDQMLTGQTHEHVLRGLALKHMLIGPSQEAGKRNWRWPVTKPILVRSANTGFPTNHICIVQIQASDYETNL